MATEKITPKTAAETVSGIIVRRRSVPLTIIASGLAGAEAIDINIETVPGTYVSVNQSDAQVQLTATNNTVTIYGPGVYQIVKGVTAGSVGVYIYSDIHHEG